MQDIPGGVTNPKKVLLEKDGVRAHAIFREVNQQSPKMKLASGQIELMFRDSYLFEPAAYQLSLLLGLDNVPPAEVRKLGRSDGSLQMWVENARERTVLRQQSAKPPDEARWNQYLHVMHVWDNLVYNTDRNDGNMLIDADWKLWMVDHTRAFRQHKNLQNPKLIIQYDRTLWEKLRTLDPDVVRQRLAPYLRPAEIDAVLARREKLVQLLEKRIQEQGENRVLFGMR